MEPLHKNHGRRGGSAEKRHSRIFKKLAPFDLVTLEAASSEVLPVGSTAL